jgi:hypothetical protein
MKQGSAPSPDDLVTLTVRVTRNTAARFKAVADAEYRPVAAEIRRLIEERIAQADERAAA